MSKINLNSSNVSGSGDSAQNCNDYGVNFFGDVEFGGKVNYNNSCNESSSTINNEEIEITKKQDIRTLVIK